VNNKIYVGVHKTKHLDDKYMGSGKVIKDAIKKYGIDNFKKDIIEFFEDSISMYNSEKLIVNEEFLKRDDVYNIRRGGFGGFDYLNSIKTTEERSRQGKNCHIHNPNLANTNFANGRTSESNKRTVQTVKKLYGDDYYVKFGSKPKTEAHKLSLSKVAKEKKFGSWNLGKVREKVKCPHCDKIGAGSGMHRFHFDNCKKCVGSIPT
jgi:hypothetical protein